MSNVRWQLSSMKIICLLNVLNSVSSQCALGKSSTAQKTEVHPKIFKW